MTERYEQRDLRANRLARVAISLLTLTPHAGAVSVPMTLEGNAPIVELEVGAAKQKAKFLIDTGGGAIIVGSRLMAVIGAEPIGPEIEEGGDRYVPLRPPRLSMGGMTLDLTGAKVLGLPQSVRTMVRNDVEGILPGSVLRNYRVTFDYPECRFTLDKAHGSRVGMRLQTRIATASGYPRIEVEIAGRAYGFLLDTGASFTMISQPLIERWADSNPSWPKGTGAIGFANMFGSSMETGALMMMIPEIKIGNIVVPQVGVVSRPVGIYEKSMSEMMAEPIVGALAGNVLRDFRVEIDYKSGATSLKPRRRTPETDLSTVGVILALANNGDPVITGLASGVSKDVREALQARDRLVAIDGSRVTGKPIAAIAELLAAPEGTARTLTLRRGAAEITCVVHTKRMLQ